MTVKPIVFMGSKRAGLNALLRLVEQLPPGFIRAVVCPDDLADSRSVIADFQALAALHELSIYIVKKREETLALLRRLAPSAVIVHGWYQLIPVDDFPNTEFFGFHYSPLPKYRGNAPLVWQIINGEKKLGVSFFVLSSGMDDGELLDQRFFQMADDENIADALNKADDLVASMLDDFVSHWISGDIPRFAQSQDVASYCGLRIPEDGRIDWTQPASVVHNFVRAQTHPYPGAYSQGADGQKIVFLKTALEERLFYGRPGAVVEVTSDAVVVACGIGALRVLQVARGDSEHTDVKTALGSLKVRLT